MLHPVYPMFQELTTKRLVLRKLAEADAEEIFLLRSDENVNRYLARDKAKSIEDAYAFIKMITNGLEKGEMFYWALSFKGNPKLIGAVSIFNLSNDRRRAEIGYELLPGEQGKGVISEAMTPVVDFVFNVLKLQRLDAEVTPDNLRSVKLLEKFNFRKEEETGDVKTGEESLLHYTLKKIIA